MLLKAFNMLLKAFKCEPTRSFMHEAFEVKMVNSHYVLASG